MIKYFEYFHGGSRNHGCEALARTVTGVLNAKKEEVLLHTFRKEEDLFYGMDDIIQNIYEPEITNPKDVILNKGNSVYSLSDMGITNIIKLLSKDSIALSIGGDNYCYGKTACERLQIVNNVLHKHGIKTALIGCSVEPEALKDKETVKDLDTYGLITARESITYHALKEAGINKNLHLIPDTAFLLNKIEQPLPEHFIKDNTIGINLSPLVQEFEQEGNVLFENFKNLIEHILNNTKYNIALIPHVVWEVNNDMIPLIELYNLYSYTGRVCFIKDNPSEVLKGYISRCKMFVGARTHATIAAYSTCVPTLVIGYSVKSKGIAKDLFGTDENYVLSVQDLKEKTELVKGFSWLDENYMNIKKRLEDFIPSYIEKAKDTKIHVDELRTKNS